MIAACVVFTGCEDEASGAGAPAGLNGTKWVMQSFTLAGEKTLATKGLSATAMFDGDRMLGSGACNSYNAIFKTTKDGSFMIVEQGWTERGCLNRAAEKVDADLVQIFSKARKITHTPKKLILSDGGKNEVVFVPFKPPAPLPLAGTTWQLKHFEEQLGAGPNTAVAASSVLRDAPITLVIKDGKATGSGGCNSYYAEIKTGKGTLKISDLGSTEKYCGDEVNKQETKYFAELANVAKYQIKGNRLRLSNAAGTHTLIFQGKP